jgi:hypothetical protein
MSILSNGFKSFNLPINLKKKLKKKEKKKKNI